VLRAGDDLRSDRVITTQTYSIDLDELALCRKLFEDHAESFGNIGRELGPEDSNPSWLGTLPAATKLARASQDLHMAARTQFSAAQEFLRGVAQELGENGQGTTEAEFANVEALQRARTKLRLKHDLPCPS